MYSHLFFFGGGHSVYVTIVLKQKRSNLKPVVSDKTRWFSGHFRSPIAQFIYTFWRQGSSFRRGIFPEFN